MPFLPSLLVPSAEYHAPHSLTSKMLSVTLPIFFSATHPVSRSQILDWLSSDHLSLPLPHHPLMVPLILVFIRKRITSKICFLNTPLPTTFCLFSLLAQSLPLPHFFDLLTSLIPQTITFFPSPPAFFWFLLSTHLSLILSCVSIANLLKTLPTPLHSPSTGIT